MHMCTNTAGKHGLKGQRPLLGGMAWAMDPTTFALESHGLKAWLRNGRYLCSYLHSALPSSFGRGEVGAPSSVVCAAVQHLESCEHGWVSCFRVGSWRSDRGDRQSLFPIRASPFVSVLLPLTSVVFFPHPLPCEGCEVFPGPNAG